MPIQTSVRKFRIIRLVIIAIVFLAFGAWGLYDYFIQIPNQQRAFEQSELLGQIRVALETEQVGSLTQESKDAIDRVKQDVRSQFKQQAAAVGADLSVAPLDQFILEFQKVLAANPGSSNSNWGALMRLSLVALVAQPRRLPLSNVPQVEKVHEDVLTAIEELGEPKKRGAFDRILWGLLFIPCLPMGLWLLVVAQKRSKRWFRLEDDGSLHFHKGDWPAQEIRNIDMSKWMSRSIAVITHTGGGEVKLDDYYHDGLHRIVGAIAHRFHPDLWTEEARKAGSKASPNEETESEDEPGDELAPSADADDRA